MSNTSSNVDGRYIPSIPIDDATKRIRAQDRLDWLRADPTSIGIKNHEIRSLKFTFNCSRLTKIFGSSRLTKAKVKANQRQEKAVTAQNSTKRKESSKEPDAFGGASGLVLVAPSLVGTR